MESYLENQEEGLLKVIQLDIRHKPSAGYSDMIMLSISI